MRQVVGNATRSLEPDAFADLAARYRDVVLDVGTGDGKHVMAVARSRPDSLVVGLDAGPDAMRRTAFRAAQKPAKGGAPNAIFVWASVEALPAELTGLVSEVHVLMPWGSLLRALVEPEVPVLERLALACRPDAGLLVTLNLHAWRPRVPEVGSTDEPTPVSALDTLAADYARGRWRLADAAYLDADEIAGLGTSWTKRLGSTRTELAVLALRGVRSTS